MICLSPDAAAQLKKYEIKSGKITFETSMTMGKMKSVNKSVVYFDDYGQKECKESYEGNTLKESFVSDGKTLFLIQHGSKTVFKRGDASRGTEFRFDWDEIPKRDKDSGKAKKLPDVTIAGKSCQSFQQTSSSGTMIFAGWKKITLFVDLTNGAMRSVTKAVKVEEVSRVPAEKFSLPLGYTVQ
jgi:hypothetical protein